MRRISACCKGWCAKKNRLTARVTTRRRGRRQTTMRGESGGRYDLGRGRSTGTKAAPPRPIHATWPRCWLLGSPIRQPELGALAFERERHGADRLGRKGRAGEEWSNRHWAAPNDGEPCRHSSAGGGGRQIRGARRGFRAREGQLARAAMTTADDALANRPELKVLRVTRNALQIKGHQREPCPCHARYSSTVQCPPYNKGAFDASQNRNGRSGFRYLRRLRHSVCGGGDRRSAIIRRKGGGRLTFCGGHWQY
jgi:hypothetical protein